MNVYYLYNSGFTIDLDGDILIVDYYRGKFPHPWRTPLPAEPSAWKSVLVLASHFHADHYNPEIFSWREERPDIAYVLSSDIRQYAEKVIRQHTAKAPEAAGPLSVKGLEDAITYLADGESTTARGAVIKAYGSTDEGISFHISVKGRSIFHAGDLNYWHWTAESTAAEVTEAKEKFDAELSKIKAGIPKIDVAFFPVDPRMGADYYRGAVLFCEAMRPAYFIPMHFQERFAPPTAFFEEISPYTKVLPIAHQLEKIELP